MEVTAQEAELPELVRDVLADVGHRAVRPDDDLPILARSFLRAVQIHHPAPVVLAVVDEMDGAGGLEPPERVLPEPQGQDVALPGSKS